MLPDNRLRGHDHERVLDKPPDIVAGFMLSTLEGIGAQVEQHGEAELNHRLLPDAETFSLLLEKDGLPLLEPKPGEVAVIGPVEKFPTFVGTLSCQEVALIIAVKMNLEVLARRVIALEQFLLDGGLAGRGDQC